MRKGSEGAFCRRRGLRPSAKRLWKRSADASAAGQQQGELLEAIALAEEEGALQGLEATDLSIACLDYTYIYYVKLCVYHL